MKKSLVYLLIGAFMLPIVPSIYAQSRLDQTIARLEDDVAKVPQLITKTIRCARGIDTCTQAEITQARATVTAIGTALAVIGLSIAAGVTAKKLEWWPFRRKKELETKGPVITPSPEPSAAPESIVEPEIAQPQPAPIAAPSPEQIALNNALNTLIEAQRDIQKKSAEEVQAAINVIESAIRIGMLPETILNQTVPGTAFRLSDLIRQLITIFEVRSSYVR